MKRTQNLLVLVFALLAAAVTFAQDSQSTLETMLRGKLVVLKQPLVGKELEFTADGHSQDSAGARGIDDLIVVSDLKVKSGRITLLGKRALMELIDGTEKILVLEEPVAVRVAADTEAFTADLLDQKSAVVASVGRYAARCSTQTWGGLLTMAGQSKGHSTGSRIFEVCLPSGSAGFSGAGDKDFTVSKIVKSVDPQFRSPLKPRSLQNGRVKFLVRIDDSGKVTDVVLFERQTPELAYDAAVAIRQWQFEPAKLKGNPVASVIVVEVNLHMQ